MAKKAKQIDNRIQSTERVTTAATTHKDQIAEALAARAVEVLGPDTKATRDVFSIVLDFVASSLKYAGGNLDNAELAVVAERADDVGLRETRDAAEAAVRNSSVRVKSMVTDALGDSALATYGLEGQTPRGTRELLSHARTVVKLLKEKPFQKEVEGVTFDSAALAAGLEGKADALGKAVGDVDREDQELKDKLGKRDATLGAWVETYQGSADTLVGLFRLAGRRDLSEAVRPTQRTIAGEEIAPEAPPVAAPGEEKPQ